MLSEKLKAIRKIIKPTQELDEFVYEYSKEI
jgi:hypothetical protein